LLKVAWINHRDFAKEGEATGHAAINHTSGWVIQDYASIQSLIWINRSRCNDLGLRAGIPAIEQNNSNAPHSIPVGAVGDRP
jgi:hypothetical protein